MFHGTRTSLIFCYLCSLQLFGSACVYTLLCYPSLKAAEPPPYAVYYSAEKGFKPVQPNLSKVFLQMAGSLESFGSPEPYIRHIMAEHARIDAATKVAGGSGSSRPAYLTEDYVDNLIANWNKISPPLKLDTFCRDAGKNIRYAILGSKNMTIPELVELEKVLNENERKAYRSLLEKAYFSKSDFPATEKFYAGTFDKLTATGKDQISRKTWLGTQSPEIRAKELSAPPAGTALVRFLNDHQDKTVAFMEDRSNPKASGDTFQKNLTEFLRLNTELDSPQGAAAFDTEPLVYSHKIRDGYRQRIEGIRKTASTPNQSAMIEKAIRLMLENLVVVAQSEFEAGLFEKAARSRKGGN